MKFILKVDKFKFVSTGLYELKLERVSHKLKREVIYILKQSKRIK